MQIICNLFDFYSFFTLIYCDYVKLFEVGLCFNQ